MNRKFILLIVISVSFNLCISSKPTRMIFIEQIYRLYESNLHTTHTDHKRNIFWLENCLSLPNIHPSQAIVVTKDWEEYVKYKLLLRFHIHYLLTKEYVDWGWEYDKRDIAFYNIEWAKEIKNSFEIAKSRYLIARRYWEETKKWSNLAYGKKLHIGWEQIEDLNYEIENNLFDYDYDTIIDMRLKDLERKIKIVDSYLAKNN
ncbi:MAG TPA: hypothetical protein PLG34_02150 [Spirochaetota bacterium]|nr:MAG: hypothetical protein BWX91_01475 [Spirochaetes bacterium ADurb.Bin133]HNZ26383.1 hypothetical protein [Spirochaetota bacterium]HPY86766.1 hypothetical protein [Spirochaetota bacterium]HQB60761.1 hypothetical protein [Spirochaetota bacterium]